MDYLCVTMCYITDEKKERNPFSFEANFFQYLFMYVVGISEMLCIAEMDQDQNIQMNADMNNNGQFTAQWRL